MTQNEAKIAIVGRPNVGKSTLFNKLSISKKVITHDLPGVTRDRITANARLGHLYFEICDTPGIEMLSKNILTNDMRSQSLKALDDCNIVLFIIDGVEGVIQQDKDIAQLIRESNKPVILLVNKSENLNRIVTSKEFYSLGFAKIIYISSAHGNGMIELCEELMNILPKKQSISPEKVQKIKILIAGRPNVGKSTYVNTILKDNRVLTGPEAGVTRDSIEIDWEYKDHKLQIVDTAGLRKRKNIDGRIEQDSANGTKRSIKFCDAIILMLDCREAISKQDLAIANIGIEEGRTLIIAVNKWDEVDKNLEQDFKNHFEINIKRQLSQIADVPIIYISALKRINTNKIIDEILKLYAICKQKFSTSKLNQWLKAVSSEHQLPVLSTGRKMKLKYCTQTKSSPITIKIFTNSAKDIPDSYKSYLRNSFRKYFIVPAVPIRLQFCQTDNPYEK
jgi:GTP-binding protein